MSDSPRPGRQTSADPAEAVSGVVWDFGGVLIEWHPFPAVAAGVGEDEARRFFDEFDFQAWNYACDAGRPWAEAMAQLEQEQPRWLEHARAYVDNFRTLAHR